MYGPAALQMIVSTVYFYNNVFANFASTDSIGKKKGPNKKMMGVASGRCG